MRYSYKSVRKSAKKIDAWWTTIIVDQIAIPLTYLIANFTRLSANQITLISKLLGFSSFYFFYQGTPKDLLIGALMFELSFILDCVDGKLARVTKTTSPTGAYLDYVSDRLVNLTCTVGLMLGIYFKSKNPEILILGSVFLVLITYMRMFNFHFRIIFNRARLTFKKSRSRYKFPLLNLIFKIRDYFHGKRIQIMPSTVEVETIVFFIAPLLNFVNMGFIIGIVLSLILLILQLLLRFKRLSLFRGLKDEFEENKNI